MKDRLFILMNHFGYTAARLADEIGVQRSGISHILSGRNQPGYDFIVKILNKFPDIDIEWLLTGRGTLLKQTMKEDKAIPVTAKQKSGVIRQADLFADTRDKKVTTITPERTAPEVTNVNFIQKIIVLYTDGTFNHYDPARQD
jgi:transcriptional regulator with XRE-family HTH domain